MDAFRTFEQFVQRLIETPFTRLTGSKLQPIELAKRLERQLDQSRTIGIGRIYAPNVFDVVLNHRDYATFERFRASLQAELGTYVQRRGVERGYTFVGPVEVHIVEGPDVGAGDVHITSSITEVTTAMPPPVANNRGSTRILQSQEEATVAPVPPTTADVPSLHGILVVRDEDRSVREVPLAGQSVRLGRGLDNDVVLNSLSVSRNHAQFVLSTEGRYVVQDLGSTNGTLLNGVPIKEGAPRYGDSMTMGAIEVRFERPR